MFKSFIIVFMMDQNTKNKPIVENIKSSFLRNTVARTKNKINFMI